MKTITDMNAEVVNNASRRLVNEIMELTSESAWADLSNESKQRLLTMLTSRFMVNATNDVIINIKNTIQSI